MLYKQRMSLQTGGGGQGGVADNAVCFTKNRIWIEWQPKGEFFI